MTPDEARDLLAGTTPGPWHVDPRHSGDVLSPENHWLVGAYYNQQGIEHWKAGSGTDLRLFAAAPALAAMIAGMREEWGVEERHEYTGEWHWHSTYPDRESACDAVNGMDHFRAVRRYVTEPEKA